ncbi:Yih1 protein [Starmerella bacillaris]|uniref:Yih1 protein n=1 Tax=Starmerella bacillaris TaxID=1247836 RepID=A0AAV5RJJ7_STABA|nr:Yih1 protein [Starmerella bacillaris]
MEEEVEIINSIFEGCATISPETFTVCLKLPQSDLGVEVTLWYPVAYPEEAPRVVKVSKLNAELDAEKRLQQIIDHTFIPGEVYMYTFLDEIEVDVKDMEAQMETEMEISNLAQKIRQQIGEGKGSQHIGKWSVTSEIRDRGSTFIGRACVANSESEVEMLLADLFEDKKVAKANHKMAAWRVDTGTPGIMAQDFDDDGEAGAGGCILHIMQLAQVTNAVVVVCRYFGGVHIGPDRFKHIKQSTRDALINAGLIKI